MKRFGCCHTGFLHVQQYEALGGIAQFLPVYLQQLVSVGYFAAALVPPALKLGKPDKIHYAILPDGEVQITRVTDSDDPLLGEFLSFLSLDMAKHPEQICVLDAGLKATMDELTGGLVPNLDQALSPDLG